MSKNYKTQSISHRSNSLAQSSVSHARKTTFARRASSSTSIVSPSRSPRATHGMIEQATVATALASMPEPTHEQLLDAEMLFQELLLDLA
jgi:hypothetical protein